ncbi:hypothetical protein B0T25DRAFT_179523 [Lasiosphaeria hispida]|uniref:Uncharacterized protein n=1 Tax=Lasiosphaeria hispida TaxID=260671 RepID=A0AAJ0MD93_9PEZI|nr:hypothetical protein B0T25DRAFT_179523 [Lasiosphaeria hispida]
MSATAIHGGTAPLAALTTVFTPPCPTSWLLTNTKLISQLPVFPTTGPASCDPPSWLQNIAGGGFQYYSPAICPRGFAVGPNCGVTKTRTAEGFPAVARGETVAYCVPAGLTCTTDTSDFRGGVWGYASGTAVTDAAVTVGPALQIRWVEADLSILETHPLTPGLRLGALATGAATSQPPIPIVTIGAEPTPSISDGSPNTLITDTMSSIPKPTGSTELPSSSSSTGIGKPSENATSNANTASSGGINWSLDGGTMIVIIIISVFVGIMLWVLAFVLIRRSRRARGRERAPSLIKEFVITPRDAAPYESATQMEFGSSVLPPELEVTPARPAVVRPQTSPRHELLPELEHRPTPAPAPAISQSNSRPYQQSTRSGWTPGHERGTAERGSHLNPAELEGWIPSPAPEPLRIVKKPAEEQPRRPPPPLLPPTQNLARKAMRERETFGDRFKDPATMSGSLGPGPRLTITRVSAMSNPRESRVSQEPWSPTSPTSPLSPTRDARVSVLSRANSYRPVVPPKDPVIRAQGMPGRVTPQRPQRPD